MAIQSWIAAALYVVPGVSLLSCYPLYGVLYFFVAYAAYRITEYLVEQEMNVWSWIFAFSPLVVWSIVSIIAMGTALGITMVGKLH